MNLKRSITSLLRRWGQPVILHRGTEVRQISAVLQPLGGTSVEEIVPTPLGEVSEEKFLCLTVTELRAEGDWILWRGREFWVQTAQPIYGGRDVSHWWCVLYPRDRREP